MDDLTGQKLGKYVLEEKLGQGGMAAVYRSTHPQLNRPVAIKVLPYEQRADDSFAHRFEREAQAMAALNHPTLIRIYDIDQQDDLFYMVMDMVQGGSLDDRLRSGTPMGLYWACDVVARVAEALDIAHRKGIIHRDIKPSNILLTTEEDPVVADFGIAKMIQQDNADLTSAGTIMGTPLYMAPEQIKGEHVDGRADLYALGVVLYQLLTGHTPFSGDTLAVITKQLHEPPPPLRTSTPDLPAPLEAVVLRALSKNPEQRFRTGAEFAAAIRHALQAVSSESMVRAAPVAQVMASYVAQPTVQSAAAGFTPTQALPSQPTTNNNDVIKLVGFGVVALIGLIIVFKIIQALFWPLLIISLAAWGYYWYQQQQKQKAAAPAPPASGDMTLPRSGLSQTPLQQGLALYRGGQFPQALAAFNTALDENSHNIDALISRGLLYYTLGDLLKAQDDFDAALRINSRHSRALYQRALVHVALGAYPAAQADLNTLLGILPAQADLRREAEARLQSVKNALDPEIPAAAPTTPAHLAPETGKLSEPARPAAPATTKLIDPDDLPAPPDATLVAQTPPAADTTDGEATMVNWTPPAK
jgi:serine/threonine-protein kinase